MQALIEQQFHGRPLIVSWPVSYNMILTEGRVVGFNFQLHAILDIHIQIRQGFIPAVGRPDRETWLGTPVV